MPDPAMSPLAELSNDELAKHLVELGAEADTALAMERPPWWAGLPDEARAYIEDLESQVDEQDEGFAERLAGKPGKYGTKILELETQNAELLAKLEAVGNDLDMMGKAELARLVGQDLLDSPDARRHLDSMEKLMEGGMEPEEAVARVRKQAGMVEPEKERRTPRGALRTSGEMAATEDDAVSAYLTRRNLR